MKLFEKTIFLWYYSKPKGGKSMYSNDPLIELAQELFEEDFSACKIPSRELETLVNCYEKVKTSFRALGIPFTEQLNSLLLRLGQEYHFPSTYATQFLPLVSLYLTVLYQDNISFTPSLMMVSSIVQTCHSKVVRVLEEVMEAKKIDNFVTDLLQELPSVIEKGQESNRKQKILAV